MDKIIEAFHQGIESSKIKRQNVCMVTDIPYNPSVVDYLGIDLFHTSRGRAIPFGTGMKLANPKLKIVVFVGDLVTLGGNHFVHGGRRNMDVTVICVNHFVYRKVGGEDAPGEFPRVAFSPYASFEEPFNVPHLAKSCGSVYVARWTLLHTDQLVNSIAEALGKSGFSVIDVISPNSDLLEFYYKNSEVKDGEDTIHVKIEPDKKIIVGKFIDMDKPTFIDAYDEQLTKVLGDKFVRMES